MTKNKELLFSCSNDKTINIWKLDNKHSENYTISSSHLIHQYHKDYIKSLCYSEVSHTLYSCGLDGLISSYNIEEYNKTSTIKPGRENIIFSTPNNNSIYSMDCDQTGRIILASIYENLLIGIDTRQRKDILHLRGHTDIIRNVRLSPDGRIVN
jgi:WD40 repeat protein